MLQEPLSAPLQCLDESQFRKVWERVMSGKSSPIVIKEEKITCEKEICSPITEFNLQQGNFSGKTEKIENTKKTPPVPQKKQEPLFCFSDKSTVPLLESALLSTLETLEDLKKLEKQVPQKLKQDVLNLTQSRKKQLCQLETAYFLLTGEDFLLTKPFTLEYIHQTPTPADKRLRNLFKQAQLWQCTYQKTAFKSQDSCLTSLFLNLEKELKEEVASLHKLVEAVFCLRNK